jgi:hypothetical protein
LAAATEAEAVEEAGPVEMVVVVVALLEQTEISLVVLLQLHKVLMVVTQQITASTEVVVALARLVVATLDKVAQLETVAV